jgi:hypothetical protein
MRKLLIGVLLSAGFTGLAAERSFEFGQFPENRLPPGFRSAVMGSGPPGEWKVIMEDAPSALASLSGTGPATTKHSVLAQLSENPEDERFLMCVWDKETFGDFKLTTRFKTVSGKTEQMAGLAFRLQDQTNYYVLRASSLGNNVRFYKVVDGVRGTLYGPQTAVPAGVWHELSVECEGNSIRCFLNGTQVIPTLTDSSFGSGKIAFWTKSDSVSYFDNTKIVYTPRERQAQVLIKQTLADYPRLLGIQIYAPGTQQGTTRLIASHPEQDLGTAGGETELNVINKSQVYYGKDKGTVAVTMALKDRNGESIAAVRLTMKSFPGQTEKNAVERAAPIVREMQKGVQTLQELLE